jgi:type I restriction enzyme S subunit
MIKVVLSSIIKLISGGTPSTSIKEYWEGGNIGWLSVNDFNTGNRFVYDSEKKITELGVKQSSTKFLEIGDIIISARGTVGALAQIGKPMCFNQSCFGIRGIEGKSDTNFLYYALKNYVNNIIKRSQGSVFNTINLKSFDLMEIQIPEKINDQRKIAEVLSVLDQKIELNNWINKELEGMAKLLYDYWFVQFDFPILEEQANAMGKPELKGKPYKSSGGTIVYNEQLKRKIPAGWGVKFLKKEMDVQYGYPFKTTLFSEDPAGKPIVRIRDIQQNSISTYSSEEADRKYKLKKMDLVIGMDGNFHMNFWDKDNCWLNQRCVRIRETGKSFASTFQAYRDIKPYIEAREKNVSRTTVGHLSAKDIDSLNVFHAPENDLFQHKKIFNSFLQKIILNRNENNELAKLRDWLLPMLMNGQVRVTQEAKKEYRNEGEALMAAEGIILDKTNNNFQ